MPRSPQETVLEFPRAFREQDEALALSLMAPGFVFTSPQDDQLDRDAWLQRYFLSAGHFDAPATTLQLVEAGGVVLHRHEYAVAGRTYRNVEATRVEDGRVYDVEVYFGGAPAALCGGGSGGVDQAKTRSTRPEWRAEWRVGDGRWSGACRVEPHG